MKNNVFVFPGQGTQSNAMVANLMMYGQSIFLEKMNIISEAVGFDVLAFISKATQKDLSKVEYTQIVVFAANVAYLAVAEKFDIIPNVVAGHSIGQYSALYAAGSFELFEAARLVKQRADLMAKVEQKGGMCAVRAPVPLDFDKIKNLCESISCHQKHSIDIAAINSDKQLVVGGNEKAIEEFCTLIKEIDGAYSTTKLPVGQAFHTSLMFDVLAPLSQVLQSIHISKPNIPLILNTTGSYYQGEDLQSELLQHCVKPVQWYKTMRTILAMESPMIYEVGYGHTLSGFFRNICKEKVVLLEDKKQVMNLSRKSPVAVG